MKKTYTGRTMLVSKRVNTLPGFEWADERFLVRTDGVVIGRRGRSIGSKNNSGYLHATITDPKETVRKNVANHRLVALAFVPNPENKEQVNHKDENILNNKVENLEWLTAKENMNYGTRAQRVAEMFGIPVVGTNIETGEEVRFASAKEAGRNGFHQGCISKCLKGKQKTHRGYTWEEA